MSVYVSKSCDVIFPSLCSLYHLHTPSAPSFLSSSSLPLFSLLRIYALCDFFPFTSSPSAKEPAVVSQPSLMTYPETTGVHSAQETDRASQSSRSSLTLHLVQVCNPFGIIECVLVLDQKSMSSHFIVSFICFSFSIAPFMLLIV